MKYSAELIGKKIKEERIRHGWTQAKLGQIFIKSEKQISKYEKGKVIPPIDELLTLCNIFDCELGYLLGEEDYSDKTKLNTLIENELGITPEMIKIIKKINGKDKDFVFNKYFDSSKKEIFKKILLSKSFIVFLEEMRYLDICYSYSLDKWEKIKNKYGKEDFEKVYELYRSTNDIEHSEEENLSKKFKKIYKDISLYFDDVINYDVSKYRVSEASRALINELFPDIKNIT